jgi:hypothetical protein
VILQSTSTYFFDDCGAWTSSFNFSVQGFWDSAVNKPAGHTCDQSWPLMCCE